MANYSLEGFEWDRISQSAKDLLVTMLSFDPSCRPSAASVLCHPWLNNVDALVVDNELNQRTLPSLTSITTSGEPNLQHASLVSNLGMLTSHVEQLKIEKLALNLTNNINRFMSTIADSSHSPTTFREIPLLAAVLSGNNGQGNGSGRTPTVSVSVVGLKDQVMQYLSHNLGSCCFITPPISYSFTPHFTFRCRYQARSFDAWSVHSHSQSCLSYPRRMSSLLSPRHTARRR
jgi:serine/threonine protein kinase